MHTHSTTFMPANTTFLTIYTNTATKTLTSEQRPSQLMNRMVECIIFLWFPAPQMWIWRSYLGVITAIVFKTDHSPFAPVAFPWIPRVCTACLARNLGYFVANACQSRVVFWHAINHPLGSCIVQEDQGGINALPSGQNHRETQLQSPHFAQKQTQGTETIHIKEERAQG